jgi:hypothetical protein
MMMVMMMRVMVVKTLQGNYDGDSNESDSDKDAR